jgi:hypothetical protein
MDLLFGCFYIMKMTVTSQNLFNFWSDFLNLRSKNAFQSVILCTIITLSLNVRRKFYAGGLKDLITDREKLVIAVGGVTAIAAGVYTTRSGSVLCLCILRYRTFAF